MNGVAPKNIEEYKTWLEESQSVSISDRTARYYEAVVSKAQREFENSSFWQELGSELNQTKQEYQLETGYLLFVENPLPTICTKPFDSFLLKTFRQNVLSNRSWPEPPSGGWLLPGNWFSRINDPIRTCFVVKYLDGVSLLASALEKQSTAAGYDCRIDYEAKEEGYYAAHFYLSFPCEVPREDWDTKDEVVSVELQITTQLQEVIRRMLHKYYEQHRTEITTPTMKWQWDYNSDEFAANYLGHILHYVEGMIMDIRDKKTEREM